MKDHILKFVARIRLHYAFSYCGKQNDPKSFANMEKESNK
jgi:hypothetical protein